MEDERVIAKLDLMEERFIATNREMSSAIRELKRTFEQSFDRIVWLLLLAVVMQMVNGRGAELLLELLKVSH
jgi:hypothetical protein